jgi:hypothetical protein
MPWLGVVLSIAGGMIGAQLDQKWNGPVFGLLNDTHLTGASYNTPYPIWFYSWRCDAIIVQGGRKHLYAKMKGAKYKAPMTVIWGRTPFVNPGDVTGADFVKMWTNGTVHYDSTRLINKDAPEFILGGNQTKAHPSMLLMDPNSSAEQGRVLVGWGPKHGIEDHRFHLFDWGNTPPGQWSARWEVRGGSGPLSDLATYACLEAGCPSSWIDFSECAGITSYGAAYLGQQRWSDWLAKVFEFYQCDMYDGGDTQRAKPRQAAVPDVILGWDDLGEMQWDGDPSAIPTGKLVGYVDPRYEIPKGCYVSFVNKDNDDLADSVPAMRADSDGLNIPTLDYSMIRCSAVDAQKAGYMWLDEQDKKGIHFEFSLGVAKSAIMPGTIVQVPLDENSNRTMLLRIDEFPERTLNGSTNYSGHRVSDNTYSQTGSTGGGGGTTTGSTSTSVPTAKVWSGVPWNPSDPTSWHPYFDVAATWDPDTNPDGVQLFYKKSGATSWILDSPDPMDDTYCSVQIRTPIGVTATDLPAATAALDFETRTTDVALNQAADELLASDHDSIVGGYKSAAASSNLSIIGDLSANSGEVLAPAAVIDLGAGSWRISDTYGGINGTPHGLQTAPVDFVAVSRGAVQRVNVGDDQVGAVYDICLQPPGVTAFTNVFTVTIAAPVAPWNGTGSNPDAVALMEYDWDNDGTQNLTAIPEWDPASDVSKQTALGRFSTSGDHGATYTVQKTAASLKVSLVAASTVKVKFEPMFPDGTFGTPVYSTDYSYRTPPTGSGGGGSSSRGTRILFSETGTPAGITGTGEQFFSSHFSIPGGMPLLGQVYKWVMWGTVSPSHDYTLRQYLGGVEIATTADPVAISNAGLTDFMAEIEMTILADGVGGNGSHERQDDAVQRCGR